MKETPTKTTPQGTGLDRNVAAALSYVLGAVTGIIFLLLEKDKFVRFHAMQSIVFSLVYFAVWMIFSSFFFVTFSFLFVGPIINLGGFLIWLILLIKAYQGEEFELPVLGKLSRDLITKL